MKEAGKKQANMARLLPPKEHRFKKGQSGNPAGLKPGTVQLKARLREILSEMAPGKDNTYHELFIRRLLAKAISDGNLQAIQLIWESFEGKATQKHEVAATVVQKESPEIKRLTKQLNELYRGNGTGSHGGPTSTLGLEARNKD